VVHAHAGNPSSCPIAATVLMSMQRMPAYMEAQFTVCQEQTHEVSFSQISQKNRINGN
jgi:hypothetical protein